MDGVRHSRLLQTLASFLLVGSVFVASLAAGAVCTWTAWAAGRNPYAAWSTLAQAFQEVETHYVDELDDTHLVYGALRGLAEGLDPHSVFLDPKAYSQVMNDDRNRYFGIGTEVSPDPAGLLVSDVMPDSPSAKVGILPGDIIVAIDGTLLAGEEFEAAAARISGPRGEAIVIRYRHNADEREATLVRDWVRVPSAWGEMLSPGVGLVTIHHFQDGSGGDFQTIVDELMATGDLQALILDLRDNPGGFLTEAVEIVDRFVGDVPIVSTRGRTPASIDDLRGHVQPSDLAIPLVIIVNSGSASASEIVAGSLRDLKRATLVGTATYGKGSVQSTWSFEDGSALRLTISRYYLPNGETIDPHVGLTPDVEVRLPDDEHLADLVSSMKTQVATAELSANDRTRLQSLLDDAARTRPTSRRHQRSRLPLDKRLAADPQLGAALRVLESKQPPGRE